MPKGIVRSLQYNSGTAEGKQAIGIQVKVKIKQSRYSLEWPRGFQEVKVPRFHDNDTGWW